MNVLEIKNLKFGYNDDFVLNGVDLTVKSGDFLAITGENGSGKSTLIKLILGDLKRDSGEIKLSGKDIDDIKSYESIGYVPQVSDSSKIVFPITSREYVVTNLYNEFNIFNAPTKKSRNKVDEIFTVLNIKNLENRAFNQLSGGQQQRVMIARALVSTPDILIFDEPTVGIDMKSKEEFLKLLVHLNRDHHITILIITHEMDIVGDYVTKVVNLKEGKIKNA